MTKPRTPAGSEPSRDEDPTGVRALLSALPEPEPMPGHVVDRINASLAAEQAGRAAGTSATTVTPLISRVRGRPARLLFAAAGTAAAVALVAVVGNNLSTAQQDSVTTSGALSRTAPSPASQSEQDNLYSKPAAPGATNPGSGAPAPAAGDAAAGVRQMRASGTRYTRAAFVQQARNLELTQQLDSASETQPETTGSAGSAAKLGGGSAGTAEGLPGCLKALGTDSAQVVRADVSTYEGKPAVIIVATTNGRSVAYAVGQQCGPSGAFLLHPAVAVPLP